MKKPSVTELISLLNKPALLKWANSIGLKGIDLDSYKKQSTGNGILYHKIIEDYLVNNIEIEDFEFRKKCIDFFSNKQIISVEKYIENDFFIGRLDIKFIYNNITYIADFKTNHKAIYFENKLQLSAYRMVDNCDKVCIISIPDFKIMEIDKIDYHSCEELLICLSKIYNLKNKI